LIKRLVQSAIDRTIKQRVRGSYALYLLSRRIVIAFENHDVEMETNGERWLQCRLVARGPVVAFDVGANRGEWADRLLTISRDVSVYCFEPVPTTFATLTKAVADPRAVLLNKALSSTEGELAMHSVMGHSDLSSAYPLHHAGRDVEVEVVRVDATTGDAEMRRLGIDYVTILKVDAEGHDLAVLEGFSDARSKGRIDFIQFEYNHATLAAGRSLRDFFRLIEDSYLLCRLLPNGLEASGYHPVLDDFSQSNWVAIRLDIIDAPLIRDLNVRAAHGLAGAELFRRLARQPILARHLGVAVKPEAPDAAAASF
jgi:FkbM family methyltransferase